MGYRQMLGEGGGCNHARSANLHLKTLNKKINKIESGGGGSSLNWGVFTPIRGGVKISLGLYICDYSICQCLAC